MQKIRRNDPEFSGFSFSNGYLAPVKDNALPIIVYAQPAQ
jgi:hypothetical protein